MKRTYAQSFALLCYLVLPAMVWAALGGQYHGSLDGKPANATFEAQADGISGTLTIGETHYILQVEQSNDGYQGTLINISIGHGGALHIQEQGKQLKLEIKMEGELPQQLELQPGNP